jgi:ATP-binding cassette subfamily C protein LapB
MDNRTEAIFKTRIKPELEDKTLLLITHRRSMLSLVDRLIVMDGGRVLADGPKNSILRALHEGSVTKSPNH